MLSDIRILGNQSKAMACLDKHVDRLTRQRMETVSENEPLLRILSGARFSPALPLLVAGTQLPNGDYTPDRTIAHAIPYAAAAHEAARAFMGDIPIDFDLAVGLEIDDGHASFVAWLRPGAHDQISVPDAPQPLSAPIGQSPASVARWFSMVSSVAVPEHDGELSTARKAANAYVQRSKAANTLRSYRAAVRGWCQWASRHDLPALPARSEDVAAYFADMALQKRKVSTIDSHRAALRYLHHVAQIAVPTSHPLVSAIVAGIRREADNPAPVQKTALTWEMLTEVVDAVAGTDLVSTRDRAILLLGFAGAFRRSELAGLRVEDIVKGDDGMQIRLARSKGDPNGRGVLVGIPRGITRHCPVRAYEAWLRASNIKEGPVFRRVWLAPVAKPGQPPALSKIGTQSLSDRTVAGIIQKWCGAAALDGDFSGHSLRRGAISTGAKDGYDLLELKRFSRHSSLQIVETYIDEASVKQRNPGRSRF